MVLFAGIFVTIEPTLLTQASNPIPGITVPEEDVIESIWYHALLHAVCWLPFSFWIIYSKKLLQKYEVGLFGA